MDRHLTRTTPCFQLTRLVLTFRQCPRARRYIVPQALGILGQVQQRRDHVPSFLLVGVRHHANPIVRIVGFLSISAAILGLDPSETRKAAFELTLTCVMFSHIVNRSTRWAADVQSFLKRVKKRVKSLSKQTRCLFRLALSASVVFSPSQYIQALSLGHKPGLFAFWRSCRHGVGFYNECRPRR